MERQKVAMLASHEASSQNRRKRDSRFILDECQKLAVEHLVHAFPTMMDKVDDALFDRVDQSENADEHNVYFETMRNMRLRRSDIDAEFKKRFKILSEGVVQRVRGAAKGGDGGASPELKLDLLDETALEESLAVANMVSKIRNVCHDELFALDKRMALVLAQKEIKDDANPLGPEIICQAFHEACGVVQTSIEVKLLVLKLFDMHVVSETQQLYQQVNDNLIAKGVLPEIRREFVKRTSGGKNSPASASASAAAAGATPAPGAGETLPATDDIASASIMNALQQVLSATTGAAAPVSEAQAQIRQTEVLGTLTALQHGNAPAGAGGAPVIDPALVGAGNINVLRELKAANVTEGMGQVDAVMFDVVAMMFDFIFDDDNVPDPMKALIGRLQIPMLKVALIDQTFFSTKSHPARKLLNTLAEAALGWNEEHDDGGSYYARVEGHVRMVLDTFDDDIGVFEAVLKKLEGFLSEQEQAAEKTSKSATSALEGRERLQRARQTAQETVAKSVHGNPVPDLVQKFFFNRWRELLVFCYFDEGVGGEGWCAAVETMDQVIWSLSPARSPDDRAKLVKLLPGLLDRVKKGMDQISMPGEDRKQFLALLANRHVLAVRAGSSASHALAPETENAVAAPAPDSSSAFTLLLEQAVERANTMIYRAAESKLECAGMGTTLLLARFHDDRVTVANIGDSRLYRLKDAELRQLTVDHSLVQDFVNEGTYTLEEAKQKFKGNVITRAVGVETSVSPDLQEIEAKPGDLFLLCSDGLTDMVADTDIQACLQEHDGDLDAATNGLIELANINGGGDNVSVVLAHVMEPFPANDRVGTISKMDGKIKFSGKTDVGRRRSHNEDNIAIDSDAGVAMLADGMGGCNAGEVASAMAVQIIMRALCEELERGAAGDQGRADDELDWLSEAEEINLGHHLPEQTTETVEQRCLDLVDELEAGAWLEFASADGSKTRGRLTWISADRGRYLFTDLVGAKVVDATHYNLALHIQRGDVTVIEGEPLVDRVIGSVAERLESGELNVAVK